MEQIGFAAENGTWRNVFLCGVNELRHGQFGTPLGSAVHDIVRSLTVEQVFAGIGIRINGPAAWDEHLVLSWIVTDEGTTHVIEVRNGTLNQRVADAPAPGSTTIILTRPTSAGSSLFWIRSIRTSRS